MRRLRCSKHAATLLGSILITFMFWTLLYSGADEGPNTVNEFPLKKDPQKKSIGSASFAFTKSSIFLKRKLSQGNAPSTTSAHVPPRWTVLQGNITIHEGHQPTPFQVVFKIKADAACQDFDDTDKKLLIFVASTADHFAQRQAIRDTWGLKLLQRAYNYRVVFLIGETSDSEITPTKIEHEQYRYGDLVQTNTTESFRNLGEKSVAGLHWSKDFCPKADFVMKTDDDILIHIPNLLEALKGFARTDSLLLCHENRMRKILREEFLDMTDVPSSYHKYAVLHNELPGVYYPPYCSGMAYVFSSSVRDRLLEASLATPVFFIEDVYLTGFCRHKAGVVLTPLSGITLRPAIDAYQAACSFRDGRITSQELKADELRGLWVEMNTQGFFCPQLLGYANDRSKIRD